MYTYNATYHENCVRLCACASTHRHMLAYMHTHARHIHTRYTRSDSDLTALQPRFQIGGDLRPVIIASGARLIMEYPQLRAANEVSQVLLALQDAVRSTWQLTGVTAHDQLASWAQLIRTRFDTDNLSVTARCDEFPVLQPLVDRLQQMQSKVDAVSSTCARMETMLQTLLSENAQIRSENAQIRSENILMRTLASAGQALTLDVLPPPPPLVVRGAAPGAGGGALDAATSTAVGVQQVQQDNPAVSVPHLQQCHPATTVRPSAVGDLREQ